MQRILDALTLVTTLLTLSLVSPGALAQAVRSGPGSLAVAPLAGGCVNSQTTLCLSQARFRLEGTFTLENGQGSGPLRFTPLTDASGAFTYSDPADVQAVVKVLDVCGFAGSYWVFIGGLTDQEVHLTVTDTFTGAVKRYDNPLKSTLLPVQDFSAFATCSAPACGYGLSASGASVGTAGGAGSVSVLTSGGCQWNAVSSVPWITLGSSSGAGNGLVEFTAAPNGGPARTGTVSIANQTFTVQQEGVQEEVTYDLPGGVPLTLVRIPAGTFLMGAAAGERSARDEEYPQHPVTLTHDYFLGKYEVTQEQWTAVMGTEVPKGCTNEAFAPKYPVGCVSWNEVAGPGGFLERVNQLLGLSGSARLRLPTEAEWERAARAGTQTRFSFGDALECDDKGPLCQSAAPYLWYLPNADTRVHEVGTKQPNGYGLYDMHGNTEEYVQDYFGPYAAGAATDPQGPASGSYRVFRRCFFGTNLQGCRSAARNWDEPTARYAGLGFRAARSM